MLECGFFLTRIFPVFYTHILAYLKQFCFSYLLQTFNSFSANGSIYFNASDAEYCKAYGTLAQNMLNQSMLHFTVKYLAENQFC